MKKLLFLVIFLPCCSKAQNIPACDSLIFQCCTFDSAAPGTLTIYVSNNSSVLFDYPGFALFNDTTVSADTVAKEEVTYFGISGFQSHTLFTDSAFQLPFTGFLRLYTSFYDSLRCTFPFFIADTVTTALPVNERTESDMQVLRDTHSDEIQISFPQKDVSAFLQIFSISGQLFRAEKFIGSYRLNSSELPVGLYIIRVSRGDNLWVKKLVIE